jgi:hypothetical protein
MAIKATLVLDGKQPGYNLQDCEYEFFQPVDSNYKPCANPKGGIIKFTLIAKAGDATFHQWMFSKADVKSGQIVFDISEGAEQKFRFVNFKQAHCIGLNELFSTKTSEAAKGKSSLPAELGKSIGSLTGPLSVLVSPLTEAVTENLIGTLAGDGKSSQILTRIVISAAYVDFGSSTTVFTNNELLA